MVFGAAFTFISTTTQIRSSLFKSPWDCRRRTMEETNSKSKRHESDLWLVSLHKLTDALFNFSQTREYPPLLSGRQEAFTEQWSDWTTSTPSSSAFDACDLITAPLLSTPYPQADGNQVILLQFEPAWQEQLALRVAGIDHVVVNAPFASMEATGPLPCVYDLQGSQSREGSQQSHRPSVIVGRHSKRDGVSPSYPPQNSIFQYLTEFRRVTFNQSLPESLASLSKLYESLISSKLEPALAVLRFQNDDHSWQQVYRSQYQAVAGRGLGASIQTFGWRLWNRLQLSPADRCMPPEQAVHQARSVLTVLEEQLQKNATISSPDESSSQQQFYLLGTEKPVLVDILLWGCLANCLANVHLVVVLADFPLLCDYVARIWDAHFAIGTSPSDTSYHAESQRWNMQENAQNAFCKLPLLPDESDDSQDVSHKVALQLMDRLNLTRRTLHEQLLHAKDVRRSDELYSPNLTPSERPFHTWHRWRMGGPLFPQTDSDKSSAKAENEPPDEAVVKVREYKHNDDVWMATAAVSIIASLMMFGMGKQK
jgi:hypothetical protein